MLPVGGIGLRGRWHDLTVDAVAAAPGQLGVYEVVDGSGEVVRIGAADARQPFGLRSALGGELDRWGPGYRFRIERTHAYRSRHLELLMLYLHDRGRLPAGNDEDPASLGRLSPA
jgi:hypothetical protein